MELLLWLQTIAFFAQVFDMARAQLGFLTWMPVVLKMLNLSDSNNIFYIFNFHLIYAFCKDYNQSSFFGLIEEMVHLSQENSGINVQFKITCIFEEITK